MSKYERLREPAPDSLSQDYVDERRRAGWRLVGVEWERPVEGAAPNQIEVPYGWRVSTDCRHLEEDTVEQQALLSMMEMIVDDTPLSAVAAELNRREMRTRDGSPWSPAAVFHLLPRLVETGPRIFNSDAWVRRHRAAQVS